jgi:hypothetical protein
MKIKVGGYYRFVRQIATNHARYKHFDTINSYILIIYLQVVCRMA